MKYTDYDKVEIKGCEAEVVRTVTGVKDFPIELFPNFYRSSFGKQGQRLYARKGDMEFYSGITGAISRSGLVDMSGLNKARVNLAYQGIDADAKWSERAEYGSCFHLLVALHERGELRFTFGGTDWVQVVDDFIAEFGLFSFRKQWIADIKNDFAAWFQFKKDKNVRIITTEVMAAHEVWRIATPLDIIAEIDFNRGRIVCNINLKTGDTHAFGDSYYLQTAMEAYLYNRQIGEHKYKLQGSFCWRPKTRASTPGAYELSKNTIGTFTEEHFEHVGRTALYGNLYKASGAIVTYNGDEENVIVNVLTPYEWLADLNGVNHGF